MSSSPPPIVADRYRLVAPLGQGGMGRVWRATDVVLHRDVAIKELVPPPGLTPGERQEMRERSLREARAIARLNNINVVRVFDVLRTDADPWIVMEYVASRSLHDTLAADGPFNPVRAAEIGLGVLNALRAAHRAGVVHRDVKPGNVLIGADGRVVLTDFGLATVPGDPNVTRTGLVLGSPAYIAPERARDGTAGPAADLWSLGATLYAAVEGSSPFARPSAIATLAALATENPPQSRNAGPLKPVLNGLLRKDPTHRINAQEAERLLLRAIGRRSKLSFPMSPTMRRPGLGRALPPTGAMPVVPGPRPPVAPSRQGNPPGQKPASGGRAAAGDGRPPVFVPGKASVGRPADKPARVDGPKVDASRLDPTRVDGPPVRDGQPPSGTRQAPPPPATPPSRPSRSRSGDVDPALARTVRGGPGGFTAADVAAAHHKKAAPEHEKSLAEAAGRAADATTVVPPPDRNRPSVAGQAASADATTVVPPATDRNRPVSADATTVVPPATDRNRSVAADATTVVPTADKRGPVSADATTVVPTPARPGRKPAVTPPADLTTVVPPPAKSGPIDATRVVSPAAGPSGPAPAAEPTTVVKHPVADATTVVPPPPGSKKATVEPPAKPAPGGDAALDDELSRAGSEAVGSAGAGSVAEKAGADSAAADTAAGKAGAEAAAADRAGAEAADADRAAGKAGAETGGAETAAESRAAGKAGAETGGAETAAESRAADDAGADAGGAETAAENRAADDAGADAGGAETAPRNTAAGKAGAEAAGAEGLHAEVAGLRVAGTDGAGGGVAGADGTDARAAGADGADAEATGPKATGTDGTRAGVAGADVSDAEAGSADRGVPSAGAGVGDAGVLGAGAVGADRSDVGTAGKRAAGADQPGASTSDAGNADAGRTATAGKADREKASGGRAGGTTAGDDEATGEQTSGDKAGDDKAGGDDEARREKASGEKAGREEAGREEAGADTASGDKGAGDKAGKEAGAGDKAGKEAGAVDKVGAAADDATSGSAHPGIASTDTPEAAKRSDSAADPGDADRTKAAVSGAVAAAEAEGRSGKRKQKPAKSKAVTSTAVAGEAAASAQAGLGDKSGSTARAGGILQAAGDVEKAGTGAAATETAAPEPGGGKVELEDPSDAIEDFREDRLVRVSAGEAGPAFVAEEDDPALTVPAGTPPFSPAPRPAWKPMQVTPGFRKTAGVTVLGTRLTYRQAAIGAAALLVVLLMVIVLAAKAFGGGGDDKPAAPKAGATGQTTPNSGGAAPNGKPSDKASDKPSDKPSPAAPSSAAAATLPAGWRSYSRPSQGDWPGFTIPIPANASIDPEGSQIFIRWNNRLLIVDRTNAPKLDVVQDWKDQEGGRSYRNYHKIKIVPVPCSFKACADWEFTYTTDNGNAQHAVKRNILVGGSAAYSLNWYTTPEDWGPAQNDLQTLYQGFQPKP